MQAVKDALESAINGLKEALDAINGEANKAPEIKAVVELRDGRKYHGTLNTISDAQEKASGLSKTDVITVGNIFEAGKGRVIPMCSVLEITPCEEAPNDIAAENILP